MRAVGRGAVYANQSLDNVPSLEEAKTNEEKKTFHASERDTEGVEQTRAHYSEQISQVEPHSIIFVDESGVNIAMARVYARAPSGQRAYAAKPLRRGTTVTMIGALGLDGMIGTMTVKGSTDGAVFRTYVEQVLAPQIRRGQVVVMDNLKPHKVAGIREAIESAGAQLIYLPPYSPYLSAIEKCWGKVKGFLRAKAARSYEALDQAITEAIVTITKTDALGWFTHCGCCGETK
ncbi:MAG: IS630 family transposase [Nitrososphaera sp.]